VLKTSIAAKSVPQVDVRKEENVFAKILAKPHLHVSALSRMSDPCNAPSPFYPVHSSKINTCIFPMMPFFHLDQPYLNIQ
jgi:hypothetical protein